ncbi:MAG: UDP-N-acetylmuramoyl-tripeptide--D-alanyl-D-alanine ligase [Halothiobacillaceae bacterium]
MLTMTLAQMVQAVGGQVFGAASLAPETRVRGLFTDTRKPMHGGVFVALRGARFDAHEFLSTAVENGAAVLIVEQALDGLNAVQVRVADTRIALGQLAAAWCAIWRGQGGKLLALTGSNGKTTTKEMLASILRQVGSTLATRGNLNNDIGVPLMLAELDASHTFAVIEMGANHAGEIAYLTALARPDVALITNTGRAHLQGFGGKQGVISAKGEIFGGLRAGGVAVVNLDDEGAATWLDSLAAARLSFSMNPSLKADVQGQWQARQSVLHLALDGMTFDVNLQVVGEHNAHNALAAAAAARALGVATSAIVVGLEAFAGVAGRLQQKRGRAGCVLWDDTYNANPDSLQAGIRAVAAQGGACWLVLGDMGELGDDAASLHTEAGQLAHELGVTRLWTVGALAARAAAAFGDGAQAFVTQQDLLDAVLPALRPDVHILIKGSRSSGMENVVQGLLQTTEEGSC